MNFEPLADAFERRDLATLKTLASDYCEEALVSQRYALIDYAAAAYALAKFIEKGHAINAKEWTTFSTQTLDALRRIAKIEKEGKNNAADEALANELSRLRGFGARLGRFTTNAVDKAFLKCGAQLYAHGASLSRAAALARVEPRDLASYVSATKMPEKYGTVSVRERLAAAKRKLGIP